MASVGSSSDVQDEGDDKYDQTEDKEQYQTSRIEYIDDDVRFVLVGKTGNGKSAAGNSILQKEQFLSVRKGKSITTECSIGKANRYDKNILVVDTPGLCNTNMSNAEVRKEVSKCIHVSYPGPNAFLYVLKIAPYTIEEVNTFEELLDIFGDIIYEYLIIVFTGTSTFDNFDIENFTKDMPSYYRQIAEKCRNRVIFIDITDGKRSNQEYIQKLLNTTYKMRFFNSYPCYSDDMLQHANSLTSKFYKIVRTYTVYSCIEIYKFCRNIRRYYRCPLCKMMSLFVLLSIGLIVGHRCMYDQT